MNNLIKRVWTRKELVFVEDLRGMAFTNEDGAHTFSIAGKDENGTDLALSGTVAGSLIRPDGTTTAMTGTIADGCANLTLSPECYGVSGRASLTIFLTSGGQKTAIYHAVMSIGKSSTSQVSPGVAADVVDLVNRIDTATASIPATYTALLGSIASDYSSSKTYKAGNYVWYGGYLYKANQDIDTAESWTSGHWTKAVLADDFRSEITDLKSAITGLNKAVFSEGDFKYDLNFTTGKYLNPDTGNIGTASGRATTYDYYPVFNGQTLIVNLYENWDGECSVALYGTDKAFTGIYYRTNGKAEISITQDGYARFSTLINYISMADAYVINKYQPITNGYFEEEALQISNMQKALNENVPYEYLLSWTDNQYLNENNGNANNANGYAVSNFLRVFNGQVLRIHAYSAGTNEAAACVYDTSKTFVRAYKSVNAEVKLKIENDGYVRICTKTSQVSKDDAYVKNVATYNSSETSVYFVANQDEETANESPIAFQPTTPRIEHKYKGDVSPEKRYLAIGFDDFRDSDFSAIIPLFSKYGGRATFNAIATGIEPTFIQKNKVFNAIYENQEIGDHSLLHYAFPYLEAPFNGQNPSSADGAQIPYPTNSMLRNDDGSGKNAFGKSLTENVSLNGCSVTSQWGSLTDAECQTIRESYSVLKHPVFAELIDNLSNQYLGTSGRSDGSWDSTTGKYTGGIFTGCATSENHEVWERILTIIQMYYKDWFGLNYNFKCWSLPGTNYFGLGLVSGTSKYYDTALTKLYNMNARFESSLYTSDDGNALSRSFAEALESFGYKYTHDFAYYGRWDGKDATMMSKQFYINADLSKPNAIMNPTNRTVSYNNIASQYPESFFVSNKPKGQQMYEANNSFKYFIDALRNDTANGMVHGEVIDSFDNYSEKVFFEEALKFCEKIGIEVITKAEAYDICFNHPVRNGNLLYNPNLINSVKIAYPNASNLPTNPDGFEGNCSVVTDEDGVNALVTTSSEVIYKHYGIPVGVNLRFSFKAKGGRATIRIGYFANNGSYRADSYANLLDLNTNASTDYQNYTVSFTVPNKPLSDWSQACAEYGQKVMGLRIRFGYPVTVKDMRLEII